MFTTHIHASFKNEYNKNEYNKFDSNTTCKNIYNAFFPTSEQTEERNVLTEDYINFKAEQITEEFIEKRISLATQKNPTLFKNQNDKDIFFFNLVQACYSKFMSHDGHLNHHNLEELLEIIVLEYLGQNVINISTSIEKIAEDIFKLQILPLVRINLENNKKENSNFGEIIEQAKRLIDENKYSELVKIEDGNYTLPAILALMYFDENSFTELLNNNDVNKLFSPNHLFKDAYGRTLLHHAVLKEKYNIIDKVFQISEKNDLQFIAEVGDDYGRNALHLAAVEGNVKLMNLLLNKGYFDLGKKDAFGRTVLHLAAANNGLETIETILKNNPKIILEKDLHGKTVLHLAAIKNKVEVAKKCIEDCNKLLNEVDTYGNTALHLAAKVGSIDILKLLGYDYLYIEQINEINFRGSTALHQAAYWKHPKAIDILIESGADLNIKDTNECNPLVTAMKKNNLISNSLESSKVIISKLVNYDYSVFVSLKPVWHGEPSFQEINIPLGEHKYIDEDIKIFVNKMYNFLSTNKSVFKPLPCEKQDHIPLITKAVNASQIKLIKKIMSDFPELLKLSEIQQSDLKEAIINNQLYVNKDEVIMCLYDEYCSKQKSKITEEQYEIFDADKYGDSKISNLIDSEEYDNLYLLLEEKELLEELNIDQNNSSQILKNIILFTCSDTFKAHQNYKENAKNIYNSASYKLFINGELDAEVFLAGDEILEMNQ